MYQMKYTTKESVGQLKYTVICAKLIGFLIAERSFEKRCEQWFECFELRSAEDDVIPFGEESSADECFCSPRYRLT